MMPKISFSSMSKLTFAQRDLIEPYADLQVAHGELRLPPC